MGQLEKISCILGILGVGVIALYRALLSLVLSILYGQFYHLPQKYFGEVFEVTDEKNLFAFLIVVSLCGLIIASQNLDNGMGGVIFDKMTNAFKILVISYVSLFLIQIVTELLGNDSLNKICHNSFKVLVMVLVLGYLILTFILYLVVKKVRDMVDKGKKIKCVIVLFICLMFLIIIFFKAPTRKKQYEIVSFSNQTYIVLAEYKGNDLVVKFDENKEDLIIDTSEYKFVDKNKGIYKQKTYKNVKVKTK